MLIERCSWLIATSLTLGVMTPVESLLASQDGSNRTDQADEMPAENQAADRLALTLSIDWTTAYYFRGIVQENQGVIVQPAAKLTYTLAETDDTRLDAFIGTWNSIHDRSTGAQTTDDTIEHWYECDLYGGLTFAVDNWTFTGLCIAYTSPSDAFDTVQELDFTAAYDDSDLLGKFALRPYATLAIEIGDDYTDGADTQRGTYLELGIAPSVSFDIGNFTLPLTFPALVGLSIDDYYEDANGDSDTFGYAQVGVKTSIPLLSDESFKLNAGVSLLALGDHLSDINGGDDLEVIGTVGLQWDF